MIENSSIKTELYCKLVKAIDKLEENANYISIGSYTNNLKNIIECYCKLEELEGKEIDVNLTNIDSKSIIEKINKL